MSIIFITEKPSVAQEYKKVLKIRQDERTDGYVEGYSSVMKSNVIITWAIGHLIAISPPDVQNEKWAGRWSKEKLPMIPTNFKYEPQKNTYNQFKIVKSLYTRKDIKAIYYAGDSGREGIYIQALIRNQIFKTAPKLEERVVWIDSFTEDAILKGIKEAKPYNEYQPIIDSGYARAMSDWLIGMNFTEAFTLTSGKLINTGRVMTPTLAMIVNRQKEIDNFEKTYFYGIKTDNSFWKSVEGSAYFDSNLLYNENGFLKEADANKLCNELNKDRKLEVENVKVQTKTEYAPYLFNLADLQAFGSKYYKISPAQVLNVAQTLYEKKLITYPRTDCRFLSSAVAEDLKKIGMNVPKRYIDDSKVTDHYAIIPTFHGTPNLSGMEDNIYQAILSRFLDTMEKPFVYDAVSIVYIHKNGERFFETFQNIKQIGYRKSYSNDYDLTITEIPRKNEIVSVENFSVRNLETKAPTPYTTGSLILAMEKAGKLIDDEELREQIKTCGIGTSATRASIIEKLREKEFITVERNQKIVPSEFGKAVIPIIEKFDETLTSPIKTADMEANLHAIANGTLSLSENMRAVNEYIETTTKRILENNKERLSNFNDNSSDKSFPCPCCDDTLKYGKYGWYCSCKFSFGNEICGRKMKESDLEDLLNKGKTKTYSFKSKAGKPFKAKMVVDKENNKTAFEFDNSKSSYSKPQNKTSSKPKSTWGSTRTTKSTWGKK